MRLSHRTMLATVLVTFGALVVLATSASSAIKQGSGSFAVDLPLSKPTTLGPANGVNLSYPADPLKLTWRAVPGAASYQVQVARQASATANCNATSAWQLGNIMLTHTTSELGWVPELTDDAHGAGIWTGTFCFRVRAAGTVPGVWSDGSRFSLSWTAQATNLRFYSDESGDVPRAANAAGDASGFDTGYLEWNPVAGATQYEIQISNATTFAAASMFAERIYHSTRLLLPQMPDNQYSWRVRPVTATGIKGSWSSTANFRIFHDDRYWGGDANGSAPELFPADGAITSDLRVGWEPVPGASYYRYMAASRPNVFTELPNIVSYGTPVTDSTTCEFQTGRLSAATEAESSTINNWVTAVSLMEPAVVDNIGEGCTYDPTPPVGNPPVDPDPTDNETKVYPPLPDIVYWRVYPVWKLSPATEDAWAGSNMAPATILGKPVQRSIDLTEYGAAEIADPSLGPVAGNKCKADGNPDVLTDCLRTIGGSMSPLNPTPHSTTMQVPYFEWGAFEGYSTNEGPGSFRVQIAQDPAFVFKVTPNGTSNVARGWMANKGPAKGTAWTPSSTNLGNFGGITRSFALTTGLPDEGLADNNGYFWRSIPCTGGTNVICLDHYEELTDSQWSPGISFGVPDSGALEFRKRVEVSTQVIGGFTPSTPMLRVGPVGASSFSEWQRGIQGADHYEFEIARNQAFDESAKVMKTTVPRIVPWGTTPSEILDPGTWFWRVRAVDRDGLAGSWSATSSFTANSPAPTVSSSSATIGVGGTVEWAPATGAVAYEVEWSSDSGFATGVTTVATRQTAYYIPASAAGKLYWRVRTRTGTGVFSEWTEANPITILAPSGITYGLSRSSVSVGQPSIIEGQLVVAGTARNHQKLELHRKATSCEGDGAYRSIASPTTGKNLDDGLVRLRLRITTSACYRFAWKFATGTMYSAPFEIGAHPVATFKPLQRKVKRGRSFCSLVTSKQALTGMLRVQYRAGRVWKTVKSQPIRGMKRRTQCAAINQGGVFPVRILLENLNSSAGAKVYEDTYISGGTVKTADSFVIIR